MDFVEVKYSLYVDAMKRTRWMLLVTVILSCLILMHIYLEQFSLGKAQIVEALKRRKQENLESVLKENEARIDELRKAGPARANELDDAAQTYARRKYRMTLSDNMLHKIEISERTLPLLSLTVPGNDFLPIVGTMLLVFVIAVWLSLRSVVATLQSLQQCIDDSLREIVRLQFTFTGLHDEPGTKRLARGIQYLAFVLPAGSFLIAFGIDAWSVLSAILNPAIGTAGPTGLLYFRFQVQSSLTVGVIDGLQVMHAEKRDVLLIVSTIRNWRADVSESQGLLRRIQFQAELLNRFVECRQRDQIESLTGPGSREFGKQPQWSGGVRRRSFHSHCVGLRLHCVWLRL